MHHSDSSTPKLEQSVEGQIIIRSIPATHFIKKPIYARENITTTAFVNSDSGNRFSRNQVSFGHLSGEYIEIRSGAKINDKILISDMSEYSNHEKIEIN